MLWGFLSLQEAIYITARLFFCGGKLLGLSAKSHIPNYGEFYEARHFSPAPCESIEVEYAGFRVPLGNDLLFLSEEMPECVIGVEICEDLWVMNTPGTRLAAGGATLLLNCSASDEVVGKAEYRRQLVATHSARVALRLCLRRRG